MRTWTAILTLLVAACMLGKKVYTYPTGNIPIEVTNKSRYSICVVEVLDEVKNEIPWNPLKYRNPPAEVSGDAIEPSTPIEPLAPGKSFQFGVRPGTYELEASSCDHVMSGSIKVAVSGPTSVTLGRRKAKAAPAGTVSIAIPLADHNYHGGGGEPAADPGTGGEPAGTDEPPAEAPIGPTCLPDGTHTGDYGSCCSRDFKQDNTGHYICCTQYKTC